MLINTPKTFKCRLVKHSPDVFGVDALGFNATLEIRQSASDRIRRTT